MICFLSYVEVRKEKGKERLKGGFHKNRRNNSRVPRGPGTREREEGRTMKILRNYIGQNISLYCVYVQLYNNKSYIYNYNAPIKI